MSRAVDNIRLVSPQAEFSDRLALIFEELLPQLNFSFIKVGRANLFIRGGLSPAVDEISNLHEAILNHSADVAIYPAELLPYPLPDGLSVAALMPAFSKFYEDDGFKKANQGSSRQMPLNGFVALVAREDSSRLHDKFTEVDARQKWGEVAITGFGPGNPGLITSLALDALETADIIFHDDLIDVPFLDKFPAEKIYVGKRCSQHAFSQDAINELLWNAAASGKRVARLKGGDPLIFGRGIEEYHYLKARLVNTRLIPGVSSAMAAAADALVPLTARGVSSSVAFLSGHDLEKLVIPKADTLVFFMAATNQSLLARKLILEGWDKQTPVAVVKNASYSHSITRRYTLESIIEAPSLLDSPLIMIVGWTAAGNDNQKPVKWLFTGNDISDFKENGTMVHAPFFKIMQLDKSEIKSKGYRNIKKYDQILFTDRNAVNFFFNAWLDGDFDIRDLYGITIEAACESAAEALRARGILARLANRSDNDYNIPQLSREFAKPRLEILVPGAASTNHPICDFIEKQGNNVTYLPVYKVEEVKNLSVHDLANFHGVVFTAPNCVSRFLKVYGKFPHHLAYAFTTIYARHKFLEEGGQAETCTYLDSVRETVCQPSLSRVI